MIRVLVVEDSPTVRARLCEVLAADPGLRVVGEAADGQQAIAACQALQPNVITLDMMMPKVSGLQATEFIMAHCPTPILVVSASINRGELFRTYDALAAGAVDVLDKPLGTEPDGAWEQRFIAAVKMVARIRVVTHLRGRLAGAAVPGGAALVPPAPLPYRALALGTSTGGPGALVQVLRALPPPLPMPLLVVQHLAEPFGAAFAEWLGAQSPHPVRHPVDGEPLAAAAGAVVVAPPGRHLALVHGRLRLSDAAPRHSCRPSVDVLFESLAAELHGGCAAALLTGMGHDGAAGLLALRRAGAWTIAQDEASSVVWGMPREAAALGAAAEVLPLAAIGPALAALLRRPRWR
ncbi:chemotaxis-specific protein-glutamate methyltransferase CheB [Aquincola sp. S2]|uniref:Protein-glutamate methylesterase/protein-glutamine glutaminase n=1 Tax=Pseudaquabacterium terrae TaxID=2732868 RepID=A0ABX2EHR9_9BURK|nr:chemotaxis-specific protein-glutamate methyltransferase CheB [Aquabacterium terrae]NRF68126.1 chemotaxis-specific protein-glutamate methyltransferase CheB [Aquabacterium terrae]